MLFSRGYILSNIVSYILFCNGEPIPYAKRDHADHACRKTKVAVLGAGMAGIMAAKSLSDNGINDFLIVENNNRIGGRVRHYEFGIDTTSDKPGSYMIELGANWVHGTQSGNGPENPIWTLIKNSSLRTYTTDYLDATPFNSSGMLDKTDQSAIYQEYGQLQTALYGSAVGAGQMIEANLPDRSLRDGLRMLGWDPHGDPYKLALDWCATDWRMAQPAEASSQLFTSIALNSIELYFSPENRFVLGKPGSGYSSIISDLAKPFLAVDRPSPNGTHLLLQHRVTSIDTSDPCHVTIYTNDTCIEAEQAITTFSLGVLQHTGDDREVQFHPPLPGLKREAIHTMKMGTYTKIFMQWPQEQVFWSNDTQFLLYASQKRGYYPIFHNLNHKGYFPGSGILMVTVVGDMALQVDQQSDHETLQQIMQVLGTMYPNTTIPAPTAFYYPRWSTTDWAYGSYSNVLPGMSLEMRQNRRANVGRLWFAGEHTSINWFGFLQGAYFEGMEIGERVAARVKGVMVRGADMKHYEVLSEPTKAGEWNEENGYIDTLHLGSRTDATKRGVAIGN